MGGNSYNILKPLAWFLVLTLSMIGLPSSPVSAFKLQIRNELTGKFRKLVYHCWSSSDEDLEWRQSTPGRLKEWNVTLATLFLDVSYLCDFRSGYGRAENQLVAAWDMRPECGNREMCTWVAKSGGVYLRRWNSVQILSRNGDPRGFRHFYNDIRRSSWT